LFEQIVAMKKNYCAGGRALALTIVSKFGGVTIAFFG
jgi:hypothetical protein